MEPLFTSLKSGLYTVLGPLFLAATLFVTATPNTAFSSDVSLHRVSYEKSTVAKSLIRVQPELQGWDFLYEELVRDGFDQKYLQSIFADNRMPRYKPLKFNVNPQESRRLYRKQNSRANRRNAVSFFKKHQRLFLEANRRYQVPESVMLAILQVETFCGKNTGRQRVFYRLARLVSASEPNNIVRNYQRTIKTDKEVTQKMVAERARWLQNTFMPHLLSAVDLAHQQGLHPLDLKGSIAGAVGLPQFLPGNVFTYGVDANGDGKVDLHSPADAIFSLANFLHQHGWASHQLPLAKQRAIIMHYNRSEPYVDTVLKMAKLLERQLPRIEKNI